MSSNAITTGTGRAPERKRNRRGFLAAGVATGLAALGLGRLASGDPAMATDGSPLIIGNYNTSSDPTYLIADGTLNATTLDVGNNGTGTGGTAIYAHTAATGGVNSPAVWGNSTANGGYGVLGRGFVGVNGDAGTAVQGVGVFGVTTDTTSETYGVYGRTQGSQGRAVFGWSQATAAGTGVWGQSNNGTGVGVRGYAWDNGTGQFGTGVMGTSGSTAFPPPPPIPNTGVFGVSVAPSGGAAPAGVVGDSTTTAGVAGFTAAPGRAAGEFTHTAGGVALKVAGAAQFAQSGLVAIAAGGKSATVTGVALRAASVVLATVQNPAGVFVQNAVPNVTGSAITINLNKAVPTGMTAKVAWFVVN